MMEICCVFITSSKSDESLTLPSVEDIHKDWRIGRRSDKLFVDGSNGSRRSSEINLCFLTKLLYNKFRIILNINWTEILEVYWITMTIEDQLKKINTQLAAKGYKLTSQRDATLRILLENEQDHMSAEEVYLKVRARFPKIGIATVYRALELLCELHIVEKMNFGDGVARYDLRNDEHEHMHHHMICSQCGEVREIKEDWLQLLEKKLEKEYGFTVTDHRLDFIGSFQSCDSTSCKNPCEHSHSKIAVS